MTYTRDRRVFPLRLKLVLLTTALSAILAAIFLWIFASRLTELAEAGASRHANGVARVVSNAVAPGLEFEEATSVTELLREVTADPEIRYASVLREDGSVFVSIGRDEKDPLPEIPEPTNSVLIQSLVDGDTLHTRTAIRGRAGIGGTLLLGFSLQEQQAQNESTRNSATFIAMFVIGLGLLVSLVIGTLIAKPVLQLTTVTKNIVSQGDLTQRINVQARDEIGLLAEHFEEMVAKLRGIPLTLSDMADGVVAVTDELSRTVDTMSTGASVVQENVESTSRSMAATFETLQMIARTVSDMNADAKDTHGSSDELLQLTDRVRSDIEAMETSANSTTDAVGKMSMAAQEIATHVGRLDEFAENTSTAMNQIQVSIRSVNDAAQETATVSDRVSEAAEQGVQALNATMTGISNIEASSKDAAGAIQALGDDIRNIGGIIDIISEVADQTNLLSLNAAIIAAQAGEHGRGFGVVADSIKALADRTSASTVEISALIQRIQNQAKKALNAVSTGSQSVQEGVALGKRAEQALRAIHVAAGAANTHMKSIALAASQQAEAVSGVGTSINELAATVQDLNEFASKQARDSNTILEQTQEMRKVTALVTESGRAQGEHSGRIANAVHRMSDSIGQVNESQGSQTHAAQETLNAIKAIEQTTVTQRLSVESLVAAMADLKKQSAQLREAVRQFKV